MDPSSLASKADSVLLEMWWDKWNCTYSSFAAKLSVEFPVWTSSESKENPSWGEDSSQEIQDTSPPGVTALIMSRIN